MAMPDLGKQIGPLPLGAWIVVVGVGGGIALWSRGKANEAPTIVDDTSGQEGVGDGSVSQWTPTAPPSTSPGVGDDITPTTNEAWAVAAINWLIAQGYDASTSDSAIRKYIAGNDPQPSIKEYALQGLALAHFGSPPQPLPPNINPPPNIPTPPPVVTPTPVQPAPVPPSNNGMPAGTRWYVVKKGDNLWNIAKKYYGSGIQYVRIFNANRAGVTRPGGSHGMISNPNLIQPGWNLLIP